MSNLDEIKTKKQIAVVLAEMVNEYCGELAPADSAKITKKMIDKEEMKRIRSSLLNMFGDNDFKSDYYLNFADKEIKLPYSGSFINIYKCFLLNEFQMNAVNFNQLRSLKSAIIQFKE